MNGTTNDEGQGMNDGTEPMPMPDSGCRMPDAGIDLLDLKKLAEEAGEFPNHSGHFPTIKAGYGLLPRLKTGLEGAVAHLEQAVDAIQRLDKATQDRMSEQNAEIETLKAWVRERDAVIADLKTQLQEATAVPAPVVETRAADTEPVASSQGTGRRRGGSGQA